MHRIKFKNLINYNPSHEGEKWVSLLVMSNYLLAAYATPYSYFVQAVYKAILEASSLYISIINGKIDSPFSRIPQMRLLYLIQFIIRNCYSYSFFKEAIEESALLISDSDQDASIKAYSLFFLNVAYIELGQQDSFELLINQFDNDLPLDIKLALNNETRNLKYKTSKLKKLDKKFRSLLKGNFALEEKIKKLYDQPIKPEIKMLSKKHK